MRGRKNERATNTLSNNLCSGSNRRKRELILCTSGHFGGWLLPGRLFNRLCSRCNNKPLRGLTGMRLRSCRGGGPGLLSTVLHRVTMWSTCLRLNTTNDTILSEQQQPYSKVSFDKKWTEIGFFFFLGQQKKKHMSRQKKFRMRSVFCRVTEFICDLFYGKSMFWKQIWGGKSYLMNQSIFWLFFKFEMLLKVHQARTQWMKLWKNEFAASAKATFGKRGSER